MMSRTSARVNSAGPQHPVTRRGLLQAGSLGLVGLGLSDVLALRTYGSETGLAPVTPAKSVIFLFLTGGLSHQDSFDMKPEAPDTVRGDFKPIATRTPGLQICEHLPRLAQQSERFALVRSVGTDSSGHGEACHMMLTGRLDPAPGFNPRIVPSPSEWPSIAALTTYATAGRNNLPAAVVLPQASINEAGEVRPGQFAGRLGPRYDAWHVNIAAPCALGNGACPHCFRFEGSAHEHGSSSVFDTPVLTVPDGGSSRLRDRIGLLEVIENQQRTLERTAESDKLGRHRQQAISVLADPKVKSAFEVDKSDPVTLERYGNNKFGLSILMAYRLVSAGVNLVQVNVGKNSTWDTHRRNFVNLKDNLLPYLDRAVSALLDDLSTSGLLESTLVVLTGEFGRTPKINPDAGRDHWGPANSVLFAGAGVRGGNVIGSTDKLAAYPTSDRQTPENVAATIVDTLGVPLTTLWHDIDGRPHGICRAEPIPGLM